MTSLIWEAAHLAGLVNHFPRIDTDGDGSITSEEMVAAWRKHQEGPEEYTNYYRLIDSLQEYLGSKGTNCLDCPVNISKLGQLSLQRRNEEITVWNAGMNHPNKESFPPSLILPGQFCYPPTSPDQDQDQLWEGREVPRSLKERCDFERLEVGSLSPEAFREEFLKKERPLILKNVTEGWLAELYWSSKEALVERYRGASFFVGQSPPADVMSETTSISDFLHYMGAEGTKGSLHPRYLWDDVNYWVKYNNVTALRHPLEDTEIPEVIAYLSRGLEGEGYRTRVKTASVTMGPACSGSEMHHHDDAFCVLVKGMKYWFLSRHDPSAGGIDMVSPNTAIGMLAKERGKEWWKGGKVDKDRLECVQHAGEFLYVPGQWYHSVFNLWPSAAINHEFSLETPPLNSSYDPRDYPAEDSHSIDHGEEDTFVPDNPSMELKVKAQIREDAESQQQQVI